MKTVTIATIILFIVFCPLFLKVYVVYEEGTKRINFSVSLNKLSVIGGYLNNKQEKLYLHISNKIALRLKLDDYLLGRRKMIDMNSVTVYSARALLRCGLENERIFLSGIASLANYSLISVVRAKKDTVLNYDFVISANDEFYFMVELCLLFNVFSLVVSLLEAAIRKVLLWKKKLKSYKT